MPNIGNDGFNYPFTATDLTGQIARIPNVWGDLLAEGLFASEYPPNIFVEIRYEDGIVTVLEAAERGSAGPESVVETERGIILKIPHIPHFARIAPEDIQDRFTIDEGGRRRPLTLADVTAKRLSKLRQDHAQTLEFLRWGALKGQLITGTGRVLYDFFEVFGIAKKTINLALDNPNTNVQAKCGEIRQWMLTHLLGESMNGVRCKVSTSLFHKLTSHPNVEKFYLNWNNAQALSGGIAAAAFPFGGILWEENFQAVSNTKLQTVTFVEDGKGIAYPTGTRQTFRTYFGPAHHIGMVNTSGVEVFVSPEILKHGAGVELKSQSNPLPVVTRPELLVEVVAN
ncbi:major capsid protein [Magnetospirillum fulvum]|uniref:Major capsid protein E n=1 Tax=Magnetospirillum fulvum MGU-K5 TaxID=1316936 RepID=S9S649_MAGFU|nr:major capsid protein [Magnetospirillum fulvum]EPY01387.1 hypothetical protein K678_11336 [Magnetospirillum fulvum MGU-K5]